MFFADQTGKTNNGSGFLVTLDDRTFGITCHHVVDEYRKRALASPISFQFGLAKVDPEHHLVAESEVLDMAVLDLTAFVGELHGLSEASCITPTAWPPGDLNSDDVLALAGFPGTGRQRFEPDYFRFHAFSAGTTAVESLHPSYLYTKVELGDSLVAGEKPEVAENLGGLSGGPVFVWRKGLVLTAELVGMVVEYVADYDLLYVRRINCLERNGALDARLAAY